MRVISVRNVNEAFPEGMWWLKTAGVKEPSRNGEVIVSPNPVINVYHRPWERFHTHPARNPNPFFHVAEAIWMLAGSNRLDWISQFNSNMTTFSDDGQTLYGAYGFRWRHHFDVDQLYQVVEVLRKDPTTRRAVIGMWDPIFDLGMKTKDLPCNTHIYFRGRGDILDMTVCCRSNDAVWGCYGSNYVHFSFLHELIARGANMKQGTMTQFSNNFHIYERHWDLLEDISEPIDPYRGKVVPIPLLGAGDSFEDFLADCKDMVTSRRTLFSTRTMDDYIYPFLSYYKYKDNRPHWKEQVPTGSDYREAIEAWETIRDF